MRVVHAIVLFMIMILSSCTRERVQEDYVEEFVKNQVEINFLEIERIKDDLRGFEIQGLKGNVQLVNRLDRIHGEVVQLINSRKEMDNESVIDFMKANFSDLDSFDRKLLKVDATTPSTVMKLYLSSLEGFLINDQKSRFEFPDSGISFDRVFVDVILSKPIVKAGEKVSGEIVLGAQADFKGSKKAIRKMILNGKEVKANNKGWFFNIYPEAVGAKQYDLVYEAILADTVLKGKSVVYIQK